MSKNENSKIQHDVLSELEWDPSVDATKIGVTVDEDVVTLNGHVATYAEKWAAERIVKRVKGVTAVANEVEVRLASEARHDDEEIAKSAVSCRSREAPSPMPERSRWRAPTGGSRFVAWSARGRNAKTPSTPRGPRPVSAT